MASHRWRKPDWNCEGRRWKAACRASPGMGWAGQLSMPCGGPRACFLAAGLEIRFLLDTVCKQDASFLLLRTVSWHIPCDCQWHCAGGSRGLAWLGHTGCTSLISLHMKTLQRACGYGQSGNGSVLASAGPPYAGLCRSSFHSLYISSNSQSL